MEKGKILFLNEKEIKELISAEQVLNLVEEVLKAYARGETINPVKLSLPLHPYHAGRINSMPSYIKPGDLSGVKVVSVHGENPGKYHLPTTLGTIILHDPDNGLPYAILGGTHITAMRTGAAAAVQAKHLARRNPRTLSIVGAGAQGFTSMQMTVLAVPGIRQVRIRDIAAGNSESFIARGRALFPHLEFLSCQSNGEALTGTDIAVYATSSETPILEGSRLDEGVTVICVSEMLTPKTLSMFDSWYVDFTACSIERFNAEGHIIAKKTGSVYADLAGDMVTGEIGDVMIGRTPGRTGENQRILATSVGMSIEDVVVARAAYDAAVEGKKGLILDFQNG